MFRGWFVPQSRKIDSRIPGDAPRDMNNADKVTIGLIQARASGDAAANLASTLGKIAQAAERGARVVCLQELFETPYFCQTHDQAIFDLAEPIPGPSTAAIGEVAARLGVTVIASLFEKRAPGLHHNTIAAIGPDGKLLGLYRKMHIPHDPLYFEKYYFSPGDLGYRAFQTPYCRVGTLICWDQWFPEAARLTAMLGAQILFYPTAIGWHPSEKDTEGPGQREAWMMMQRAHAISNGVFVAACNRVGVETSAQGSLEFWGTSFVCDPFGRILAQASATDEEILIVDCDLGLIEKTRRNWPFLRDRRTDSYGDLVRKFGASPETGA